MNLHLIKRNWLDFGISEKFRLWYWVLLVPKKPSYVISSAMARRRKQPLRAQSLIHNYVLAIQTIRMFGPFSYPYWIKNLVLSLYHLLNLVVF